MIKQAEGTRGGHGDPVNPLCVLAAVTGRVFRMIWRNSEAPGVNFHQEKTLLHKATKLKEGFFGGRSEDLRGGKGDLWERNGEARGICGFFLALGIKSSIKKSTGCSHRGLLSASCELSHCPIMFSSLINLHGGFEQGEQGRSRRGNPEVCPGFHQPSTGFAEGTRQVPPAQMGDHPTPCWE